MELAYERFFLVESHLSHSRLLLPSELHLRSTKIRNSTRWSLVSFDSRTNAAARIFGALGVTDELVLQIHFGLASVTRPLKRWERVFAGTPSAECVRRPVHRSFCGHFDGCEKLAHKTRSSSVLSPRHDGVCTGY